MNGLGIESGIPNRGELFEVERNAEALTEVEMPIVRGNAAFLPIRPARIFFDGGPKLFGSEGKALSKADLGLDINADQHASNIEDDRADSSRTHTLVPFQLVATNVGQPRSEALFEIAPSASRFQVTLSPAGVVNA